MKEAHIMKQYRKFIIVTLIMLFVGMPMILSAADNSPVLRSRITPLGNFNLQDRELNASPQIKMNLMNLRALIKAQNLTFEVGYTAAADFKLEQLATLKVPANINAQITAQNLLAGSALKSLAATPAACSATAASYDWRQAGGTTSVKDQGACGSCWDFATIGSFEGSWNIINNEVINASEQDVLSCSGAGSCGGGWWAFNYLINTGVAAEASFPYTATNGTCKTVVRPYKAAAWGYVGNSSSIPSVASIKQALCAHGPLAVAVNATSAFQHYTSGVFNEHNNSGINHGVTLIGWNDSKNAWLVKNSWGTGWGSTCDYGTERGYIWIAYGSNNIGYAAAWSKAATATTGPTGYTKCAGENGRCSFSGTKTVAYGENGIFAYKAATNGINCNNSTFGDPLVGIFKSCYVGSAAVIGPPAGYTKCAGENGRCNFSGTKTIAYGENGIYAHKTASNGINCNNSTFGDPLVGIGKSCYVK